MRYRSRRVLVSIMGDEVVPYLCSVKISGPEPDSDEVSEMMDAVAHAIEAGWEAPRVSADAVEDVEVPDESSDDDRSDGRILDYRVLAYPGGAIVLVVLDGGDLLQTSVAVAGLAGHLTTWSPGLLEYSPDEIKISTIDEPYDDTTWLPPLNEDDESESERPHWRLAELLGRELLDYAAKYLLAQAVRSLRDPTHPVDGHRARDIVLGSVESPWRTEMVSGLGVLLVQAARVENSSGAFAELLVQGSGAPELAADLLRRSRETGAELETDGWTDDEMRGHVLVESFMKDHDLLWNRVKDDESDDEYEDRSQRQLRALLWAGLRALATMSYTLRQLSGPWQLLDALGGDDITEILAEEERDQADKIAAEDDEELESSAMALVLFWLAIRNPELLRTSVSESLMVQVADMVEPFHHLFCAISVMTGSGPLKAAIEEEPPPNGIRADLEDFAAALARTEADRADDPDDPYNDMHAALEVVLDEESELTEVICYLLDITTLAARFTATSANPNRALEGYVSDPLMLTYYLLVEPTLHAAVILHRHDDDDAVRTRTLSLAASVAPIAAGDMARQFPSLSEDDPRVGPAWRARALRWIETALRQAEEKGDQSVIDAQLGCSADALELIRAVRACRDLPADWSCERLTAAGAEAAAAILHSANATECAEDVFGI